MRCPVQISIRAQRWLALCGGFIFLLSSNMFYLWGKHFINPSPTRTLFMQCILLCNAMILAISSFTVLGKQSSLCNKIWIKVSASQIIELTGCCDCLKLELSQLNYSQLILKVVLTSSLKYCKYPFWKLATRKYLVATKFVILIY